MANMIRFNDTGDGSSGMYIPIANDFDPSATGLVGKVGAIAFTADGTKAWKRWGTDTANRQWLPLHTTTTVTASPVAAIDVTLNCDTLGGFRVDFCNLTCDTATTDSPRFQPRVNGALIANASTTTQRIAWSGSGDPGDKVHAQRDLNLVGGTGVWFGNADAGVCTVECRNPEIANGVRVITFRGVHCYANTVVPCVLDFAMPAAAGEIVSIGLSLVSTSTNARIPAGAKYRVERFP